MNFIEWMHFITYILIFLTIVGVGGIVAIVWYVKFKYKPKPEVRRYELYENFDRKNVEDYIPVEDIEDGIILLEDKVTYVAVLICKGFDFFYSHPKEQMNANLGYVDFVQSISQPIQLRMSTKQEDLEEPIDEYIQESLHVMDELTELYDKSVLLEANYDDVDTKTKAAYAAQMTEYNKVIENREWEIEHIQQIVNYMKEVSSTTVAPIRESCYIVDWTYNENEFPEGTTQKEIFERAKKELYTKAESMKYSLSNCNVKVMRADSKAVRELVRGHMQPYGKNIFKTSDIEKSNYDELIVTSHSLAEARARYEVFLQKNKETEEIQNAIRAGIGGEHNVAV